MVDFFCSAAEGDIEKSTLGPCVDSTIGLELFDDNLASSN